MNLIERDLVVLGGGVTGLGVARLAARAGWSVTVVERDDLGHGASSATSHMLHGGLRYLEHGRFSLVREALHERMAVARLAPTLSQPVRFVVPLRTGDRVGPLRLRAALALYDMLSGQRGPSPHLMADTREALALEPGLEPTGLRIRALALDGKHAWRMTLGEGIEVLLGRREIDAKMKILAGLMRGPLKAQREQIARIDMRYSNGFSVGWRDQAAAAVGDGKDV